MKKYIKYILLPVIALSLAANMTSCSKELNIKPTSELENDYFESEVQIQSGVGACYAAITNMYGALLNDGGGVQPILLLPGDDIASQNGGNTFDAFAGLNSSNGQVSILWSRLYQMIYRCNFILEKLDEDAVKKVYTTAGLNDINKGEVLFLRSWAFYRLWDLFRKAPVQDKRIRTLADAILPPSSGFEMLDRAIEDLETAAKLLPEENFWAVQTDKGRVFNESAYGLLVKCYTLRARYSGANTGDYQKAISAFEKITGRELVHFADNFDYHHENNKESLFEFQASHAGGQDNLWLDNNFGGDVGQMGVMYHYSTAHWTNYMVGIMGPSPKLLAEIKDGDPRKQFIAADFTTNVDGDLSVHGPQWNKFGGYQLMKYVYPGRCWFEETWGGNSSNNLRLIRYADTKLLAAEAYLQTGDQAKALAEVNDIRARARRSTADNSVSTVPANLTAITMQDIMNERFVELAAEEGIRWTDLRSWHAAGFINLAAWKAADFGYTYNAADFEFEIPKHLLFPIPQRELETNPLMAASGNNPGY